MKIVCINCEQEVELEDYQDPRTGVTLTQCPKCKQEYLIVHVAGEVTRIPVYSE